MNKIIHKSEQAQLFSKNGCIEFDQNDFPGWGKIINDLLKELHKLKKNGERVEINLIKEKYGCLRVQGKFSDRANDLITLVMNRSEETCAICGEPGVIGEIEGYYLSRCEEHS